MSGFANIVLNDGNATPVARTFAAVSRNGYEYIWRYVPSGQAMLAGRLVRLKFYPAAKPDQRIKVELKVIVPIVDAPAPVAGVYTPQPRVVDTNESNHLMWVSPKGVQADRDDFAAYTKNILNDTQILDVMKTLVPPT